MESSGKVIVIVDAADAAVDTSRLPYVWKM